MVNFKNKAIYPKGIIAVTCLSLLMGFLLLFFSSKKDNSISTYKEGETSVVLVDLTKTESEPNYQFIYGMSLLLLAIGLLLFFLFSNKQKEEAESEWLTRLSKKENEILPLVFQNMSNKEIANELCISTSTVKSHINNIFKKLNIKSRAELKNFL